jgi:hypothetical protein|tara:strand:+ start:530 stop:952 length:423 start_codon:yes stop_codon:yes gene_type:complete
MNIKELAKKYNLDPVNDFWELARGSTKKWIITHDAVERIATIEGIIFDIPDVYVGENKVISKNTGNETITTSVAMIGKAKLGDREIWTTGESSSHNTKNPYFWAMSEKRLKDRLCLKLIQAYEYGIYSEDEADAFRRTDK